MAIPLIKEKLIIEGLRKSFRTKAGIVEALRDINLSIESGEFVSIVGASGCGKSTLLRIIAGLELNYEGSVKLGDRPIKRPGLDRGFVFQDHRLLPWLTVERNIAFGLKFTPEESRELVAEQIELVGLKGFEKAYPSQLSGGMAQRASIARAIVNRPEILLLDEPFGSLDAFTRIQMQEEMLRIWRAEGSTMILVTHDIDEAIFLSDRVYVLSSRPGVLKNVFDTSFMPRPRDRNGLDFIQIRRSIYKEFFSARDLPFSYAI